MSEKHWEQPLPASVDPSPEPREPTNAMLAADPIDGEGLVLWEQPSEPVAPRTQRRPDLGFGVDALDVWMVVGALGAVGGAALLVAGLRDGMRGVPATATQNGIGLLLILVGLVVLAVAGTIKAGRANSG